MLYQGTLESDLGLRDPLAQYVQKHWKLLSEAEDLKQILIDNPELSYDVLNTMASIPQLPMDSIKPLYDKECCRCASRDMWKPTRVTCTVCDRYEDCGIGKGFKAVKIDATT